MKPQSLKVVTMDLAEPTRDASKNVIVIDVNVAQDSRRVDPNVLILMNVLVAVHAQTY